MGNEYGLYRAIIFSPKFLVFFWREKKDVREIIQNALLASVVLRELTLSVALGVSLERFVAYSCFKGTGTFITAANDT